MRKYLQSCSGVPVVVLTSDVIKTSAENAENYRLAIIIMYNIVFSVTFVFNVIFYM